VADFIAGGHLARHVRRTRELYRQRQQHLVAQAAALTGGLLEVYPAPAGMRVVKLLPAGVSARAVAQAALRRDVFVTPLPAAAHERVPPERDGPLLGYAGFGAADTRAALLVLRDVIRGADRTA
jgi:GntR family transcriptional regulator/MocR family aminotransferase